ncbi:MAG: serine hydrolase domain-containing protein [Acidobacteriota bacterium]
METDTRAKPQITGAGADRLPAAVGEIAQGIDEGLHLGAQLYVSIGGRPVADFALGGDREGRPLEPTDLALWLSATKPVTAVAVGQLWERGLLALDDPVARHLPEFGEHGKGDITLRHLLTHTGGIRMLEVGWPHASWEEILDKICQRRPEPRWTAGEKAGYHLTSSWFVLGEVIRRLDGRPFSTYVRQEIFEPLDLDDSWIGMPEETFEGYGDRIAKTYNTADDEGAPFRRPREHSWHGLERVTRPSPGGNGRGPIRELGRFYEALAAGGALDGRRILRPQTVEALTARHRVGLYDHTFKHILDWGLGFIPDSKQYGEDTVPYAYGRLCSRRTWGHSGYRSSTGFADAAHGLVVALVFNGTPDDAGHDRRMRRVLEAIYWDLGLAETPDDS